MPSKVAASPAGSEKNSEFLDTLANGLRLMEAFDEQRRSMTIQSAAELLRITRPASRRILLTLAELGYLHQDERQFALAPKAIELGYRYFRSLGLAAAVRPHLQTLSRELGAGAAIGMLAGTDVLFVERVEADRPIKLDLRAGDRLPAYAHSLGRALLALLPEERLAAHLPTGTFSKLSPHTVTERKKLLKELERVRERGWSFVNSELVAGLFGVAIALPSAAGPAVLGLNVTSIGEPWSTAQLEQRIVPRLRAWAEQMRPITDTLV
ncbi:helix-turn-helix domain-containing protein [Verticiella sediminum]|uniref:Helix-turn-helix domain-containing protein n=1 Tax=Verticiella sediminum TaxID=1247510 RepID=A0A556B0Z6_9BURK|nr:IclR family transcriptional regulator C-terminal domain-containing protein [Verticiella sediminum]TSH98840.1 helix-turn-helix domain-containing protein [Verticiella sediminum]